MMSPETGLHDPVLRAYVCIVALALIAGGVILAFIQFVLRRDLGSIWQTYRSWLIMAPLATAVVFAGRVPFIIGVTLAGIFGFRELAKVSGLNRDRWITAVVYCGIAGIGLCSLRNLSQLMLSTAVFALILLGPVVRNRAQGQLRRLALGLISFVLIGSMFGHLGLLANTANPYGLICFVIFATELCDVAAFTFGRLLGRRPLCSGISPRKTWEGAIGGLAVAMALPWLLRFSFPAFGTWQLVLTGLIVGIGGQLGDLSMSVIKRVIGTKDMAMTIPGHGGILDRIDSLIYVAPLFVAMIGYYSGRE